MRELLRVENLKIYAGTRPITSIDFFSVREGEVVLVTGSSGSGKTSMLRCIAGLNNIFGLEFTGSITLNTDSRGLAYIPQEPWFGLVTPYPFIEIRCFGSDGDFHRYLELFNVGHVLESNSVDLSAGEIQRILLIEALLSGSKLVLMDEITAYLDEASRKQIVETIEKVRNESRVSFIVVDHDVTLWKKSVDKVLYIDPKNGSRLYNDIEDLPIIYKIRSLYEEAEMIAKDIRRSSSEGETLIKVDGVWFRYPDSTRYVVRGLSIDVDRGDLVVIQGPSGSGKSTFLKLLAGMHRPSKGKISRRYRDAQYVPENPLLYLSEPTPNDELKGDIEFAKEVALLDVLETPITRLSSGERRRLALASAMLRGADVIFIDEPSVGLDVENLVRLLRVVAKAVNRGVSIVMATHSRFLSLAAKHLIKF
uniref:ATP-binding cassette domain-containing protein n=1 Tax=Ignisphaera aggregans TaxID=334771 RepID=A0A7C2VFW8_9CREN